MRVPSFDVTLIVEFFVTSAACGKEFIANRSPQKIDKKNRVGIISVTAREDVSELLGVTMMNNKPGPEPNLAV